MSRSFARLFSLLTTLEREYGLTSLDAQSRAIFDYLVQSIANGHEPTTDDIVSAGMASRATTYRRLAALREAGLIKVSIRDNQTRYSLAPRLSGFRRAFAQFARQNIAGPSGKA